MANKQRGEMALNLGPKKYVLRPSFQLLCEIEEALGVGLITFARRLMAGEFGVREIATVFAVAVRDQDGPDTEETGKLIVQDGVAQYVGTLTEFLTTALSGNQKEGPQREGHCHPPPRNGKAEKPRVNPLAPIHGDRARRIAPRAGSILVPNHGRIPCRRRRLYRKE